MDQKWNFEQLMIKWLRQTDRIFTFYPFSLVRIFQKLKKLSSFYDFRLITKNSTCVKAICLDFSWESRGWKKWFSNLRISFWICQYAIRPNKINQHRRRQENYWNFYSTKWIWKICFIPSTSPAIFLFTKILSRPCKMKDQIWIKLKYKRFGSYNRYIRTGYFWRTFFFNSEQEFMVSKIDGPFVTPITLSIFINWLKKTWWKIWNLEIYMVSVVQRLIQLILIQLDFHSFVFRTNYNNGF